MAEGDDAIAGGLRRWHGSFLPRVSMTLRANLVALALAAAIAFVTPAAADLLPGFTIEPVAAVNGFLTSVVADSRGTLYYTTLSGDIFRVDGTISVPVAHVPTAADGNAGLLGMALVDDATAVVHYTDENQTHEVISRIDLATGGETVLHSFVDNSEDPSLRASSEHHGGNPIVAPDGSVYVGFGDFFMSWRAPDPAWSAGKIFRVAPNGMAKMIASGFRNPFDLAWEPDGNRLVVPDNGDGNNDEINVVVPPAGGFFGWPYTAGDEPFYNGAKPPAYVFRGVVAPTGIARLDGTNPLLPRGYLLTTFVTKSLLYVPDIDAVPVADPIAISAGDAAELIDVTTGPAGEIYVATGFTIYRVGTPRRGDCNGDGVVDRADALALRAELADGDPHPTFAAQEGSYRGSWGCDVDLDGTISAADVDALLHLLAGRPRTFRRR